MENSFQCWLVKIDRFAAWTLLITIVLFFISGFGMTKGFINQQLSADLHSNILTPIGLAAFSIHTFLAIRMALMRNRKWNQNSLVSLVMIYSGFIIFFAYVGFFYQKSAPVAPTNGVDIKKTAQTADNDLKTFTLDELAIYDGKNGSPAYAAVDGIVYDLSSIFINGAHRGHNVGQDLTAAFNTQHSKSQLTEYPVVGKLVNQ
ncbi:MAG: cytochrome b5 domain-containing protein [Candidatus Paceibacterota bacterium]